LVLLSPSNFLKILFTASKNPNFFSRLIQAVEGTKFTHVLIETDLCIPNSNDPLCFQSSWSGGFNLVPRSIAVGTKEVLEFDDGLPLDWKFIKKLLEQFSGFYSYGYPQILGRALGMIGVKPPKWLLERYSQSGWCVKVVLLLWAKAKKPCHLDLNLTGPAALLKFLQDTKG